MVPGETRTALVKGRWTGLPTESPFTAEVYFEAFPDSVYFRWEAWSGEGQWLGSSGQSVPLRTISTGEDPFEIALLRALESISRHEVDGRRQFEVEESSWQSCMIPQRMPRHEPDLRSEREAVLAEARKRVWLGALWLVAAIVLQGLYLASGGSRISMGFAILGGYGIWQIVAGARELLSPRRLP